MLTRLFLTVIFSSNESIKYPWQAIDVRVQIQIRTKFFSSIGQKWFPERFGRELQFSHATEIATSPSSFCAQKDDPSSNWNLREERHSSLLFNSLPTENSIDIGHEIHMINGIFWRTRKNDHMSVSTHSIFSTNTLAYWPHCCKNVQNELLTHRSFHRYLWNVSIHILSPDSNFDFHNHTKQPQCLIINQFSSFDTDCNSVRVCIGM